LSDATIPNLIQFSDEYAKLLFGMDKTSLILFTNDEKGVENDKFTDIARALRGQSFFVVSGTDDGPQK